MTLGMRPLSQEHIRESDPMKTNHKLTLAVLAGVLIGVTSARAIYAQPAKTPPAYVIA